MIKTCVTGLTKRTDNGNDMTIYEMLLDAARNSIREAYNRKVNDQLDASADALLPTADSQSYRKD